MALGWNGDALAAAAEKPVNYVVGKEGGEFWVDSYVIPVGAKNPDAAHAWIDYVYDPKHNAVETAYTYYGSPLQAGAAEGRSSTRRSSATRACSRRRARSRTWSRTTSPPRAPQLRSRIWTEFKNA